MRSVTYVLWSPECLDFSVCVSTDSLDIGKPVENFDDEGIAGLAIYSSIDSAELATSDLDARLPLGLAMESMPTRIKIVSSYPHHPVSRALHRPLEQRARARPAEAIAKLRMWRSVVLGHRPNDG